MERRKFPEIGQMVEYRILPDDEEEYRTGIVKEHYATQFLVVNDAGWPQIVMMSGDWKLCQE